jgi:outer membrane cobalamin receptor
MRHRACVLHRTQLVIGIALTGLIATPQDVWSQRRMAAESSLPPVNVVTPRTQLERRVAPQVAPATAGSNATENITETPAASASEKNVSGEEVNARPFSRPAEALEVVPGLIITQHSGDGKANQYFLRGFNLDHGTDLGINVDGMPVNMRTHGHGQGYADLNFLIPELIGSVNIRKARISPTKAISPPWAQCISG